MTTPRRVGCVLLTVALTASMLSSGASAGAPAVSSPNTVSGQITLVTGDRLTVSGNGFSVTDNPARRGVTFYSYVHNGHLNVLPSDAAGLVGLGAVDARLFDVTALLEAGLGGSADLPLIVTQNPAARAARAPLAGAGAKVERELPSIAGLAVKAGSARGRACGAS